MPSALTRQKNFSQRLGSSLLRALAQVKVTFPEVAKNLSTNPKTMQGIHFTKYTCWI